ncbi:AAEL011193-PA [Aedes aegypti]|uniref:AAEL011193-PA n=1 Tax=Aedes aegypti TaxID=7159 RepID=Q16QT1_AEDAE|nr:AAEL011193-PA [Aedes aegypti]
MLPVWTLVVPALIGLWALSCWLYDNLKSLVQIVIAVLTPFFVPAESKTLVERFGKWAVITGSTDGIGRQYAIQLAARGVNIVLISRTVEKLMAVANEIEQKHQVKTKWIAADFSQGRPIYDKLRRELDGIPVGILVNNVGTNLDYPDDLDRVPEDKLWDVIHINIAAATMLTRIVLPGMKQRRQGAIVNISSGSELQPLPYMTTYAASKFKTHRLPEFYITNIQNNYRLDINLITHCSNFPLFPQMNNFSSTLMKGGLFIPDAESYAKYAVFTLGKTKQTTGYWSHGIQYCLIRLSPEWVRTLIGGMMNKSFREEYYSQSKASAKAH